MNVQALLDMLAEKIRTAETPEEISKWTAAIAEAIEVLKAAGALEADVRIVEIPKPYPVYPPR